MSTEGLVSFESAWASVAGVVGGGGEGGSCAAILFDLDGTLCDSFQLGFQSTKEVLGVDYPITEDDYHQGTKFCTPERLARHVGLVPGTDDFQRTGKRLGESFDKLYIAKVSKETAPLFSGIKALLTALSKENVRLGCLTNAAVAYAHAVLGTNEIKTLFSSIHGADDVPEPKPSPLGLLQCCSDLEDIHPSKCIYIGDSPSDGAAGKRAGMMTVGCTWGSHKRNVLEDSGSFDFVIDGIIELSLILEQFVKDMHHQPGGGGMGGVAPVRPNAEEGVDATLVQGFCRMAWLNEPGVAADGSWSMESPRKLCLCPGSKTDLWRKTYYTPLLVMDNAPALVAKIDPNIALTAQVEVTMRNVGNNFDQAGIYIRFDALNWIKTGIEFVEGEPRLSCVVTRKTSDWSTQPWVHNRSETLSPSEFTNFHIRLTQTGDGSYAVEASLSGLEKSWEFIRITHMDLVGFREGSVGVYACCPVKQNGGAKGFSATFQDFSVQRGVKFSHTN
eukprot:g8813.t1